MGRFEMFKSDAGFYWLFVGTQGQYLGRSDRHYSTRAECLASIYVFTAGGIQVVDRSDGGVHPPPSATPAAAPPAPAPAPPATASSDEPPVSPPAVTPGK